MQLQGISINMDYKLNFLLLLMLPFTNMFFTEGPYDRMNDQKEKLYKAYFADQFKKYNLTPSMTGSGSNGKQFKLLNIGFNTKKSLNIDEARRLLLLSVKDLLDRIDRDDYIHPFLIEVPFPAKRLDYEINVVGINGMVEFPNGPTKDNKISYVQLMNGIIYYMVFTTLEAETIILHKETYEEALDIIAKENQHHENK